jgi:hypothetical protein
MEMKLTVEGLEKERDFYFGKLRDVEVLCQEHELTGGPVVRKVRKQGPFTEPVLGIRDIFMRIRIRGSVPPTIGSGSGSGSGSDSFLQYI